MVVVSAVIGLTGSAAVAQDRQKSVLSFYTLRKDGVIATTSDPILERMLKEGLAGRLDYYAEYIDVARFPEPKYQEEVQSFLLSKYKGRRFDLLIALGEGELDFLVRFRDIASPETPIVFFATGHRERPNATGVTARLNLKDTLDTAIRIQPDTQRIVVLTGASQFDKSYETLARDQFKTLEGRLQFTYLSGLPVRELVRQVANLPAHSILLYTSITEDEAGEKFLPYDLVDRLSAVANVPLYAFYDKGLGHGIVGGRLLSPDVMIKRVGELALRVLRGERPETIPVAEVDVSVNEFDWRQLQRWGIDESLLPAGSTILFRQPSAWQQFGPLILAGALVLALQSVLVVALLLQRNRRTRVERELRESEERFRLMADTAPVLVWRAAPDKLCDFFNKPWLDFTGRTMEQELGNGWSENVSPDDLNRCLHTYISAFDARQPFRMEYRLRRADGVYRWVLDSGVPRYGPDASFAGYIGSCIDITERREVEESLQGSQKRYTMATAAGSVGVWEWNLETNQMYVDSKLKSMLGFEDREIGNDPDDWGSRVHADDAVVVTTRAQECIYGRADVYEVEHRMLHKDGSVRWFLSRGSLIRHADGTPLRLVGTDVDITERKCAEREKEDLLAQLQRLAGRLIAAQEVERARIARDLHDDVSQQLAGLAITLSSLKRRVGALSADEQLQGDISSLHQRTIGVAESVRELSHDLHSSVLQHAGLEAALAAHCEDLRREQTVELTLSAVGNFESIDPQAALCLYRIAQEALRNVMTHAQARHAEVRLLRDSDVAELTIADDGMGFQFGESRRSRRGLGLTSIDERARLAGGTVSIATEPNKGTQVRVRIPLAAAARAV